MAKGRKLDKKEHSAVISKLLMYIRPYRKYLVLSIFSALVSVVCTLAFPMLTGEAIDTISSRNWALFYDYLLVLLAVAGLSAIFQFVLNQSNNKMAYSIIRDIRRDLFDHLQELPISYLDSHTQGDIVSRMIADVDQIADGLLMGFTQLFTGVLTIVGTLGCLFYINWIVALVVVLVTPISLFTASFIAKRTYSLFHKQSEARGEQTSYIDEMISGASVVNAFSREGKVEDRFEDLNGTWASFSLLATFYSSLTNPVTRFVNSLVYTGVALSGGLSALMGKLSVGALSATLTYASQYTKPFNEISGVMTELQNALASADRVFELIDEKREIEDKENAIELKSPDGNIDIDRVYFSYNPNQHLIEDFSLSVKHGMKVAIVGPTGCGKTTVINLLMRFYDVNSGSISVDGNDIRDIKRKSLRKSYGMVLQDTWLKNGTIRENLLFSNPNASNEDIERVVKLCHLDSLIDTLPLGYDEMISDEADSISQGQKQLMCIARVMLSNPSMLILDEATSSIDTRTELMIQEAFGHMMKGRTSFIVAHRLSTIKSADLILVMNNGNIVEKGTHEELLAMNGFYANLYNSQFAV